MATSIPSSMSFEMLSRLPANSFVQTWKEIRPDQAPQNGKYDMSIPNQLRFVLRGAPNEFALNTNMYVCGESHLNLFADVNAAGDPVTTDMLNSFSQSPESYLKRPVDFFRSSRESFNAGALPYLDNQDPVRSHVINKLRYTLARRNTTSDRSSDEYDLKSATGAPGRLQSANPSSINIQPDGDQSFASEGVVITRKFGLGAPYSFKSNNYGSKKWQVPLGTYSNFVNSHSVIPLGLLSSYAVNGWQIELTTQEQTSPTDGLVYNANLAKFGGEDVVTTSKAFLSNIRVYIPIVRVLDPSVMSAVLSLYEKQEQVAVGGVQFPLSLRINSMAYRFANFPLTSGVNDYFFRIAGTDRSVRAVAWWVYQTDFIKNGQYATGGITNDTTDQKQGGLRVARLETNIGSEHIHDPVEDTSEMSSNVANFISMNIKRSGALFSPLPYYQEGRKNDGQQDDDLLKYSNTTCAFYKAGTTSQKTSVQRKCITYGVVSMENLDRREGEYSGSFQASGKDLTNVGAIEMRMRFENYESYGSVETTGDASTYNVDSADTIPKDVNVKGKYEIVFAYAYDSVMEVSPSGVMDVTNAVL